MLISPELDRYAYDVKCPGFLDPPVEEEVIDENEPENNGGNTQVPDEIEEPVTDPTDDDDTLIDGEEEVTDGDDGSIVTPEEGETQVEVAPSEEVTVADKIEALPL